MNVVWLTFKLLPPRKCVPLLAPFGVEGDIQAVGDCHHQAGQKYAVDGCIYLDPVDERDDNTPRDDEAEPGDGNIHEEGVVRERPDTEAQAANTSQVWRVVAGFSHAC